MKVPCEKPKKKITPLLPAHSLFFVLVLVLVFSVLVLVLVLVLDYSSCFISGCIFFCDIGSPGPRPALVLSFHRTCRSSGTDSWDFQTDQMVIVVSVL